MFILYAVLVGLVVGALLGGRMADLSTIRFEWAGLAIAGLVIQVVLFADPVVGVVGAAGPPIYVGSTLLVFVAVLRNRRLAGLPIVALGAASNLVAIVANGGYMPTSAAALASFGRELGENYSNSRVGGDIVLEPLTDVFVLPAGLPVANVFSVGDVLIGIGVAVAIVVAMRRRPAALRPA